MATSMKATVLLCGLWLVTASGARAQTPQSSNDGPRFQIGAGFLGGGAVGDFSKHVGGTAGVLLHGDVGLPKSPFNIGGEFSFMQYGSETRRVDVGNLIPDIPDLSLKVDTDNEIWMAHARVRAQRRVGLLRPYADGLFGVAHLSTTTSISGALTCSGTPQTGTSCSSETAAEATNASDTAPSYGGTVGLLIGSRTHAPAVRLDLSVRYLRGGVADYLTKGAIVRQDGRAILNVSRSRTDMVLAYVGVAVGR